MDVLSWLDDALTPIPPDSPCCPKCRRGNIPGQFPCGLPGSCPNPNCAHHRKKAS